MELKYKRTYTSKHHLISETKTHQNIQGEFHCGIIHYENKLKLGDGKNKYLRECSWDLVESDKGWGFEFNNFQPLFPKYADEVIRFRDVFKTKDQVLTFRAICKHVEGKLIDNKIEYKDAFGEGADLILYATRSCMRKEVRITRSIYKGDYKFRFVTTLPQKINFDVARTSDEFTQIKELRVWDSKQSKKLPIRWDNKDGKTILLKNLNLVDLTDMEDVIYTDTTTSYYAGAGDGRIYTGSTAPWTQAKWDTCHDATTGTTADPTGANSTISVNSNTSGTHYIQRQFWPVDTSDIPDTAVVSAATMWFKLRAVPVNTMGTPANNYYRLVQTTQASNTTLVTADFDTCGAVNNPTSGGTIMASAMSEAAYYSITLNATALTWISLTGYTKLGCREGVYDCEDALPPTPGSNVAVTCEPVNSETALTTSDPYLSVTYTLPTGLTITGNKVRIRSAATPITVLEISDTQTTQIGLPGTNYTNISAIGDVSFVGTAGFYPRVLSQAAEPAAGTGATQLDTGEMCFWIDTDDSKCYLCYNQAGTVKTVELA